MNKNLPLVFLSLGSNQGDMHIALHNAITAINALTDTCVTLTSPMYKTEPWGVTEQPHFLNMVCGITTLLTPQQLLQQLQRIEQQHGRVRTATNRWQQRTLDIDILLFDSTVINSETLVIPHPHMHLRKFVLVPLNDIAPLAVHPLLTTTIAQLLVDCKDSSWVVLNQ